MNLTLYYRPGCPYCQKVLRYMNESGLSLPMKNISDKDFYRWELLTAGGKQQVPCLLIDGQALYESSDIIDWLRENKGALTSKQQGKS